MSMINMNTVIQKKFNYMLFKLNISYLKIIHAILLGLVTALLILFAISIDYTAIDVHEKIAPFNSSSRILNNDTLIFTSIVSFYFLLF